VTLEGRPLRDDQLRRLRYQSLLYGTLRVYVGTNHIKQASG
jgi:hypothetical protein